MRRSAGALLAPRASASRPADFATRAALIANQREPRRRRRARRAFRVAVRTVGGILVLAAIGVVGVVAVHWLSTTPWLAISSVEVVGLRRLAPEVVRGAARIEPGTNLLVLEPDAVEARVEALPGVRRARVVRHLPGRVTLLIEEREPYALAHLHGHDRLVWIDAEGDLVGPAARPSAPSLPILSGVSRVGGPDQGPSAGLRSGIALLRAVQRAGGRVPARVSEIDLAAPDGPVLFLADGAIVRLGADAWDERLARLDGVLGELEARQESVLTVDLRFRDLVVLTPRPPAGGGVGARGAGPGVKKREPH